MTPDNNSRRDFLKTSAAAVAASSVLLPGAHAAGNDVLRVGLVGCGGRGTSAAGQALRADPNVKLVAMCDIFRDRLEDSLRSLKNLKDVTSKIDVPADRRFADFDGYQKLLDCGVDVVLLCTSPGFRPLHLRAAIEANKHVFCEKPVAVDPAGVRSVLETARLAKEKNLSLLTGYCWRYDHGKRETVKRVHSGMIGDVSAMHITYLTTPVWPPRKERAACNSDMEYQIRNWYYYTWLSGDFIVEQHCHNFDKANWVFKGEMPTTCTGVGGRQVRTGAEYGNVYDHFAVSFDYKNGAKLFSYCRQMAGCKNDINDHVIGTKGAAHLMKHRIKAAGGSGWTLGDEPYKDMYQVEHDELFAGIRAGKFINDGESAAHSTLMSIMAREAAYSGKEITWEQAIKAEQNLVPKEFTWGAAPEVNVPYPGVHKFA